MAHGARRAVSDGMLDGGTKGRLPERNEARARDDLLDMVLRPVSSLHFRSRGMAMTPAPMAAAMIRLGLKAASAHP